MSRSGRPKSYFEPWVAARSKTWEGAYKFGPPVVTDPTDAEQGQAVLDWEAARHKAEQSAPWVVWGSRMADPSICVNMTGSIAVMDDRRIIAVAKSESWPAKTVTHDDVARRIASCVSACAGIADPEAFIKDVRALVLSYCRGECDDPRQDNRVLSILARCVPPEELEQLNEEMD